MPGSDPRAEVSPRDALARLLDGVQSLFREHLALAKIELKDDLRRAGRELLLGAAGLPPLLVGYLLLMVALALLIALALPGWIAFALVALLNLLVGGALTKIYGEKTRREKIALPRTEEELRRDREWLASPGEPAPGQGAPAPATLEAREADRARSGEPMTAERNEPLRH
jgi:uncharacterized membrane protein YqjE